MLINGLYLGRQKQNIDPETSANEKSIGRKKLPRQGPGTQGQPLKPQLTHSTARPVVALSQQDEGKEPTCATRKAGGNSTGRRTISCDEGEGSWEKDSL